SAAADATDNRFGDQALDGPALGQEVTDLRARDGLLGAVDPLGPPTRGNVGHRPGRPGHDGQGDQTLEILGTVPGAELGDQVGPHDEVQLNGVLAGPGPDL